MNTIKVLNGELNIPTCETNYILTTYVFYH